MPLETQFGEVADRLRSFFKITGRIPSQLDEVLVPVAQVVDIGAPPYAIDPVLFQVRNTSAAVAAKNSALAIALPESASGTMVVDRVHVEGGAAAFSASLILDNYTLLVAAGLVDFGPITRINGLSQRTLAANVVQSTVPTILIGSNAAVHTGFEVERAVQLINTDSQMLGPWVLPPGGALALWCNNLNNAIGASFKGRYFATNRELPS